MFSLVTAHTLVKRLRLPSRWLTVLLLCSVLAGFVLSQFLWHDAERKYEMLVSDIVTDRHGIPISISENSKGHYVYELSTLPPDFINLLITKEDQYFWYHPGINPISLLRAVYLNVTTGYSGGASTITQQLAKNLLGTETERTVWHKFLESLYAISIELYTTKTEVLTMYTNLVYLGHQVQGFETASQAYFNKPLTNTSHSEQIALLATLSHPSTRNPWADDSHNYAKRLNERISPKEIVITPETTTAYSFQDPTYFEVRTAGIVCTKSCRTTVDTEITTALRAIIDRHVNIGRAQGIRSGAVVVIGPHTSELIAIVGSRNPASSLPGDQINMAIAPRPIGSTIKPILYAKSFAEGLRPYTLVEDREYKYPIATGFPLYPKNYDGRYRGEVTLHEALSNSLNVPTVKVLEYIGLGAFYSFLSDDLKFRPLQSYDNYQYGIALGGLEMDLLTLTHYFTLFPRGGTLTPLRVRLDSTDTFELPPQSRITQTSRILPPEAVALTTVILQDRFTGVEQFGLENNLNLTQDNYGVKTGTSRDYHDSWVIGYTPDFVVGVWLGNTENEALDRVSGSQGAGAVWREVMEYLFTTSYNQRTPLIETGLQRFTINATDEWGLPGDDIAYYQSRLQADTLILNLHAGDVFAYSENLTIPLQARQSVTWTINGEYYDTAKTTTFTPDSIGRYEISATDTESQSREVITITVTTER